MYLLYALGFSLLFNIFMFLIAYRKQTDKLTDISYSLTFIALAVWAYLTAENTTQYSWLIALAVVAWAVRLGTYLLIRIRKTGKDKRFDEMRSNFRKFLNFWLLQGVTVWVVSLGVILFYEKGFRPDSFTMAVGFAIWATGLLIESVADYQKYKFIQDKSNTGKWIDSGLWKYSRHPNYLGEILVWYGLWLALASGLEGATRYVAAISPLFIMFLLLFVSGIPLLEKSADKRWGKDPEYQKYKRQTSILLLLPKGK